MTRQPRSQSALAGLDGLDPSVVADLVEYLKELVRRDEQKPVSQSALDDLIINIEEFLRPHPEADEIILPKAVVVNMVELLKKVRLGGHPGRSVEDYIEEWAIHIKAREHRKRLRTAGKPASEADRTVIGELKKKYPQFKKQFTKDWLDRRYPRRYSRRAG
jgi:hypothetical protein